jgi:hypothetical protein
VLSIPSMMPNPKVVFIVVGTLAAAVLVYVGTLSACALLGMKPDPKVIEYLKDIGLLCAGAISGILSRTGQAEKPVETKSVNTAQDPVITAEVAKP